MRYVATDMNLAFGKDVKMLSIGTPTDYKKYLDDNQN